ncbi:hypothetical protein LNV23_22790 [Paucibacter sp. DJ1R-11]|uniref:hypothetical protein n=1 Tax=Paucibacter sp. DJ1R-11 TaxID=2893556 RepID=UPI0021E4DD52|nr:hypothetical protein [Paucibacter sp. DJ1R-11]MCV2366273.1 hypothetical protein [Paucibacter sp. DJ1R-11]
MQNKIDIVEHIADELEADFICDYSGRGMYGEKCVAISIDSDEIYEAVQLATLWGIKEIGKIDSMGRGVVIYWPDLEAEKMVALK